MLLDRHYIRVAGKINMLSLSQINVQIKEKTMLAFEALGNTSCPYIVSTFLIGHYFSQGQDRDMIQEKFLSE